MNDYCHMSNGVHIPGCMGCAALGHFHCTCHTKRRSDSIEERLERLELRVEELRESHKGTTV